MKRWGLGTALVSLALALAGCSAAATPAPTEALTPTPECAEDGRVEQTRIESPTLGFPIDAAYYLPPCYDRHTWASYPVLYLIPGRGGSMTAWNSAGAAEEANEMIRAGEIPPFVIVSTSNYSTDAHGQALIDDLVPWVDDTFRTLAERRYRAVGGASMGGVIAYRMAFQHPDLFGSVGIFGSGVVGGDERNVDDWIAATSTGLRPRVLLDCGEGDTAMLINAEKTVTILDEWGIPYTFNSEPGAHSMAYWSSNLALYYEWYAEEW
jgi:enterochelin esterase-like enzyme